MKSKIELAWIVVSDLDDAIAFYRDVVGLSVREVHKEFQWAEMEGEGGARLGLAGSTAENPMKPGGNAIVTLSIDNMDRARSELENKGAQLIGDVMEVPNICKLQLFADKDGNQFQLVENL